MTLFFKTTNLKTTNLLSTKIFLLIFFNILYSSNAHSTETFKSIYDTEIPIGEVRTRFNIIAPERTPLVEFSLKEINEHNFSPVRIRKDGFIPRLSIIEEYNDNILFEENNMLAGMNTIISPGFNLVKKTRRAEFELDYSFESTIYPNHMRFTQAFENHNLIFFSNYQLTDRTFLSFTDTFYSFLDRTNQVVPSGSERSRMYENDLNIFINHKLSNKFQLMSGYHQILNTFDDQQVSNVTRHEGKLSISSTLSKQSALELEYIYRYIKFDDQSANFINSPNGIIHLVSLKNIYNFSETFSLSGKIGLSRISKPFAKLEFTSNLLLSLSTKDSTFEISYTRDVSSIGGFNTLLRSDSVFGSINTVLINKLHGKFLLNLSKFKQMSAAGIEIKMIEPSIALEYIFSKNLQLRLAYRHLYQHIKSGDITISSNRLNLGLVISY